MIHSQTPPFVPHTHGNQASTRYFESEDQIIDQEDVGFESDSDSFVSDDESNSSPEAELDQAYHPVFRTTKDLIFGKGKNRQTTVEQSRSPPTPPKHAKDKKRPRDKILRDPNLARRAMDVRKKQAFLGYTYRRPEIYVPGSRADSMNCGPGVTKAKQMSRELPKEFLIH